MDVGSALLYARLRKLSLLSAYSAMIVSLAVLFGWGTGTLWLVGLSSRYVTMKPLTALCFFLSGFALSLLAFESSVTPVRRRLANTCSVLTGLVGLATLFEFASGLDLHFDNLLFRRILYSTGEHNPGRVSVASASCFVLLALALLLIDFETRAGVRPAQFLAFAVTLVAMLHFLGYFYSVDDLYRTFRFNTMAIHSAILFFVLGLGVISGRPDRGFAAVFNGSGIAGRMARSVLPLAVLVTALLGWLRLLGERAGFYGTGFGLALFASSNIAVFCFLVGWAAYSLQISDSKLDAASRDLAIGNERVQETNARLAAIVASSEDAIFSKTLDGTLVSWNDAAGRMFGYSAAEILGQSVSLLFPEDRWSEEVRILQSIKDGRSVEHFESVRLRKDASRVLVSVAVSPICDSSGVVVGASSVIRDITQQRRTEMAAIHGEARLSAIIGSAMDAIITIDDQHRITVFNDAAEKMFGCSSVEALKSSLDRFIPTRFRAPHSQQIHSFGQNSVTRRTMGRIGSLYGLRCNGEEFPIEASISHADVDGQKFFTVILRDVTARHRADEEIRLQARLLDLAPVIVRDIDSRVVLWTRGAQELYGFTAKEAVGRFSHDLLQTSFPLPLKEIEETLLRDGSWEGELTHRARDGRRVVVASSWVLHHDASGHASRILEVNTNLTDLKRVQNSQMRSQKLESLGTLAGGVAHDFNNILLAINGNASLASSDLPPDHPIQQNLSEISKAGARAADLVRRILAFSRPHEQKREPQAIQPVVEEGLKLVRATIPAGVQIETSFQANLPAVALDATQIHQIIVNLATNASHAIGDKPGAITVRLNYRDVNADDCALSPDLHEGPYVVLLVSDTGCGMDRAMIDRIFDPFFTTKPVGQGTGLGLSVVHGIVSSYNGAIIVYSEPGKGTSFSLYFPALDVPAPVSPSPPARSFLAGHHELVLYVDDEEGLVMLGTVLFERLGYRVIGFTDPTRALADFRSRPNEFAAVVTDLSMPHMSGFDLARELQAIRSNIPILMTSGFVRTEDQQAADAIAIRRIIPKPSTLDQLAEALADSIQSQSTTATAP